MEADRSLAELVGEEEDLYPGVRRVGRRVEERGLVTIDTRNRGTVSRGARAPCKYNKVPHGYIRQPCGLAHHN